MGFFVIFGAIIALVIAGTAWHNVYEKKRTKTLESTAAQLGLDFAATDGSGLQSGFTGFQLFTYGRSKTIKNIAYGRLDDVEVMIFEYSYVTGSGKNKSTRVQTVAFFQSDQLTLPEFVARPESIFDKIGQVFGYHDIDLPMHPEFSKRYILRGAEEFTIREFFTPQIARFFENNLGLSIETKLDRFILYQPSRRLKPEQWSDRLVKGREMLATLLGRGR